MVRAWRPEALTIVRYGVIGSQEHSGSRTFDEQARWLAAEMRPVALTDVGLYLRGRRELPPRAVVLTIDDCTRATMQACLPVLERIGLPATFFVAVSELEGSPGWGWSELKAMCRDGVDIGSRGMSGRALAGKAADSLASELLSSRSQIESMLGRPCIALAYPGPTDAADPCVQAECGLAGYRLGLSLEAGFNAVGALDPFDLRRVSVEADWPVARFEAALSNARQAA